MLETILLRARNLVLYGHYIPVDYFVFDRQRLVYISIPKVACTSIKIALMGDMSHAGNEHFRYMHIHHDVTALHRPYLPRRARDYFKFAFVRNPFDRLVSFYEDKIRRPTQHDGRYYFDSAYNKFLTKKLFGAAFAPDMTFPDFARLVNRVPDWLADAHFKSQYAVLFRQGRPIPDFIGHFENIERDWELLTRKYGVPPLEHKNPTKMRDWRSYYADKAVVELVAARYRNDLLHFKYEGVFQELSR
jgi:chondroitin 4-sulfotransferase 11